MDPVQEDCNDDLAAQGDTKCSCSAGYYREEGICRRCAQGTFKTSISDSPCTPCPEGALTLQAGSRRLSDCRCLQGFLALHLDLLETFVCERCPPLAWPLNGECACNAGYTGQNGSCSPCHHGETRQAFVHTMCSLCPCLTLCTFRVYEDMTWLLILRFR